MKNEIYFSTLDEICPYLKDEKVRLEYIYIRKCDFELNSNLVKRGYRRFGKYFQKPVCASCSECKSLRVDALNFKFTKSLRRNLKKNSDIKVFLTTPLIDKEHLELFKKYHKFKSLNSNWKYFDINFRQYYDIYVTGHFDFGKELSFYKDDKLVCVDLIDIVDDGISSIYCYYDPDFLKSALGKFSLLKEIELAKNEGLRWIYLGHYVKDCGSLNYKANYRPFEILKDYVSLDKEPIWQ